MNWEDVKLGPNERLDDLILSGRRIIQNETEFCFSLDAVLLAHFPEFRKHWKVLDLGTGTGVMPLLSVDHVAHFDAVELNPVMAELAKRNVELNGLAEKIAVQEGDYRSIRDIYPAESFDLVMVNPPYRPVSCGVQSKKDGVARACHEVTATLKDVVAAARYALKFRGRLAMIHIPERLQEIMTALQENHLAVKKIRFVEPKEDRPPNMVLIEAIAGGTPGGIKYLPPLVVHGEDGRYTDEVMRLFYPVDEDGILDDVGEEKAR